MNGNSRTTQGSISSRRQETEQTAAAAMDSISSPTGHTDDRTRSIMIAQSQTQSQPQVPSSEDQTHPLSPKTP
ncbi:hypothetical protein PSHT_11237 [Puccinia striiformis]|uniref:Uncharacterized protein n=1 Tax=Puccinia striiformis TaxID=27350 RepID=A0A2S4V4E3_9BASI|nr:hypothetical protein PSHT_11237 [Puccinia striiformis]